jgi:aromatic-L-amino-acid decarboxylase
VKISTDELLQMDMQSLANTIEKDIANGYLPLCIVVTLGTTGTTAMDSLSEAVVIAKKYDIWVHVDAAYAGSALLLPEYQFLIDGIKDADSFVFNPHKWLFTNFDCSAYFVKDKNSLVHTFEILPEYLKTKTDGIVSNHCDWGVPLGRRFRSLKLWFVMRYYGLQGLQEKLRFHIELAKWFENEIIHTPDFNMLAPRTLNLVCFHYNPDSICDQDELNTINEAILQELNLEGEMYLTHTKIKGNYTLRMCFGQTNTERIHVEKAWFLIKTKAKKIIEQRIVIK